LGRVIVRATSRRTGLARRHVQSFSWSEERYAADPRFYQFTAGVISLVVAQRLYDSLSSDSKSHEKAHTTHEAPAVVPQEEPENEAPAVVETSTPPQAETSTPPTAPLALETPAPLPPAPAPNEMVLPAVVVEPPAPVPSKAVLPAVVVEPPVPASNEMVLPAAIGNQVGVGNVLAFSDGANVWVVEARPHSGGGAGLYPGGGANGEWVRARQMTDLGAGEAPPLLEGISADAGWVLATQLTADGSRSQLLAVPGIRAAPSGRALLAAAAEPAINLTPTPRASVDKVTMGAGGALLEVSGLAPAGAAVFRAALPAAGSGETPSVSLDTNAPAGGELVEWLVDEEKLAVRGALVLQRPANQLVLLLRAQEQASGGNSLWLATCTRLGLPFPPLDPNAPPAYSEWRAVASWDAAAPRLIIGFRSEHAWLTDPEGHVIALNADGGEVLKLPLR